MNANNYFNNLNGVSRLGFIAVFVAPALYTFGNSGTGILAAFKAFNHAKFGTPNVSIGTPSAGITSSGAAARILQLALKLSFPSYG